MTMRINGVWGQRWPELMFDKCPPHLSWERRQNYYEKKPTFDRRHSRISVLGQELDRLDRGWQEALGEQEIAAQNVQDHELARWQPKDRRVDVLVNISRSNETRLPTLNKCTNYQLNSRLLSNP